MNISTKKGDDGTTSLMFGRRVSKTCAHPEAYGAVDEFFAAVGLVRSFAISREENAFLMELQKALVKLMTELATAKEDFHLLADKKIEILSDTDLDFLENKIKEIEASGVKFTGWTVSDENSYQASAGLARAICRRAEREVVRLKEAGMLARDFSLKYLNRMSDLLWLLSVQ